MQAMPHPTFERNYVLAQSFHCFFAGFLYLLGYTLSSNNGECTPLLGHVSLLISIGFLIISVALIVSACWRNPPIWANRILETMEIPIHVGSIGGAAVTLIQGTQLVSQDSILFQVVFYAGFLFYIIIPIQLIFEIVQRFQQRRPPSTG